MSTDKINPEIIEATKNIIQTNFVVSDEELEDFVITTLAKLQELTSVRMPKPKEAEYYNENTNGDIVLGYLFLHLDLSRQAEFIAYQIKMLNLNRVSTLKNL